MAHKLWLLQHSVQNTGLLRGGRCCRQAVQNSCHSYTELWTAHQHLLLLESYVVKWLNMITSVEEWVDIVDCDQCTYELLH